METARVYEEVVCEVAAQEQCVELLSPVELALIAGGGVTENNF